ncbi:interferon alpha-4-like [Xenopus tropicalis]|uniref:Interferon alpha-4-like n=1 Tax=Xenopus tropicalis TaxID=8364 RepID=A0A8J1IWS5_XENTR|nr:interferon alpha-4-like [Xenopus tropicalis]
MTRSGVTTLHMASIQTILLLVLIPIVQSQNCKWLQPKQEYLNRQTLKTFEEMNPPEDYDESCQYDSIELPNIDEIYSISQMEEMVLAVRGVLNETMRFYMKHHESMGCKQQAWERFQQLLYYQINQLEACIPETAENPVFNQTISDQYQALEQILQEKNTACTRDIIQSEIRGNLQLVGQLASRARRQRLLQRTA